MKISVNVVSALLGVIPSASVLADEDVFSKLTVLKPGHGLMLGKADVVGNFNEVAKRYRLHETGPRARDFSKKMVWAPERKTALFCGANHGVPHRLNDVWEFDLAAMRWTMLYAPDNARSYTGLGEDFSDVEFKDGVLITKRGGPAIIAHSWWGLSYDPKQREMFLMNTWVTKKKEAVELLGGDPGKLYQGPPLWAFSPERRSWRPIKTEPPYPRPIFGGMLEYLPTLNGTIWHANNWQLRGTWHYDGASNSWRDLAANSAKKDFEKQAAFPEQVGYYDPVRNMVIAHRHKETFHYEVEKNEWKKVLTHDKESTLVPYGHDAYSSLCHDPKSGHGLLIEFKTNTLWSYDPDSLRWTKIEVKGVPIPEGRKRLAYFDPARGVFVIIHDTNIWVYRYSVGR